jgi:hypothetical protein
MKAKKRRKKMSEHKKTYFTTDGFKPPVWFSGLTFGGRWNGWEVPYFTKAVALEIVAQMPDHLRYSEDIDAFVYNDLEATGDEDCNEYFFGEDINGEKYYSIGGCSWCWDEVYEEEEK